MKRASVILLMIAACASSETTSAPPYDGGASETPNEDSGSTDSSSPPSDGGKPGPDASDAAKDTGASTGAGSCVAPKAITLPFTDTAASTSVALDSTSVACGAPASLSEAVYKVVLATDTAVRVTANDKSGQGIGVQVREDSCTGTSVECGWQSNGVYDKSLPLPAGTWLFVVERNPEGTFAFSLVAE